MKRRVTEMSYSLDEKIIRFAIFTRLTLITLQFLANILIPDHDAGVFQKPLEAKETEALLDALVNTLLGGLTRWDAQYYLHIAEYGYTYENTLAFFPFFPLLLRRFAFVLTLVYNYTLGFILPNLALSSHSALVIVSVLINNYIFVQTSLVLFKLSCLALKNEKLAFISSILFALNPASVFFSAAYSESLYCFFVFYGLLELERRRSLVSYIILGLSGAVRSNGLFNIGFLGYSYLKHLVNSKFVFFYSFFFYLGIIISVLPFLAYQMFCYIKFCVPNNNTFPDPVYNYGVMNNFIFPGNHTKWCEYSFPFAYSYVQKHYWNVGLFSYYEAKQIPNFLLAAPMVLIVARGTYDFVKQYKSLILYLGFVNGNPGNSLPLSTLPYFVHGAVLTIFALLVIHIQVITRLMASSTPLPYWLCAHVLSPQIKNPIETGVLRKIRRKNTDSFYERADCKKSGWKTFLFTESFSGYAFFIKWYFISYFLAGTIMFSNYLPWT